MDAEELKDGIEGEEDDVDPGQAEEEKYPNLADPEVRKRIKEVFNMFDKEN